ncbi:MAG TPA: hypothetical protein VL651_05805 [Bacteroidia bacterium]|jgi:hypothetical protein|nr:hypothetical protein [Bacteroidia bacterium]
MSALLLLETLEPLINKFSPQDVEERSRLLYALSREKLPHSKRLKKYQDVLLFMAAYPANNEEREAVLAELGRMRETILHLSKVKKSSVDEEGLMFSLLTTTFSYDLLKWAARELPGQFRFDSFDNNEALPLLFRHTLPDTIKEILTEDGMNDLKLMKRLFGKKKYFLPGLLREASELDHLPTLRDQLFDALGMNCTFHPDDHADCIAFNRLEHSPVFYHSDLLKKIDPPEWLNKKLPSPAKLDTNQKKDLQRVIRMSLLLLGRETEPSTWMDEQSIRIFHLERGVSVCIYGMTPDHRQPLESYFGFTAFKNGYPMSYGGAWLFGKRALFGMNIFEWFRGGESAFVFAQLLRVYRQFFGIDYFEVEPYQYGKDNPEGIQSGAFWFYHRFGFRLLNKQLHDLSEEEAQKIAAQKGYRTSPAVLKKFTSSNIALNLSGKNEIPLAPASIRERIVELIRDRFKGDSSLAKKILVKEFQKLTGIKSKNTLGKKIVADLALFILSGNDTRYYASKKKDLQKLVTLKTTDESAYQSLLRKILK